MTNFEFSLPPYEPKAVYFSGSDCIEYARRDDLCVYERIDNFLTLIYDVGNEPIGFKLKGFGYFVRNELKEILNLTDSQALQIVEAIVSFVTKHGDEITKDVSRREAYKVARDLAANNYVELPLADLGLAA